MVVLLAAVTGLLVLPAAPAHAVLPQQSDNAAILHFQCNGAPNQRFTPEFLGLTTDRHQNRFEVYRIVSDWSGKCIQVLGEKTNSGAQVVQKGCNGHGSQRWLSLGAAHHFPTQLVNGHTIDGLFNNPRCLDVPGGTTGWANMQIWSCHQFASQRFTFVP